MTHFSFKKKFRLLSNIQFQNCKNKINKMYTKEFIRLVVSNCFSFPRLGVLISKKNIKKSHDRNRIKRLIKESFRLSQHSLMSMDFLIIVNKNARVLNNKIIFSFLRKLWLYKNDRDIFRYK